LLTFFHRIQSIHNRTISYKKQIHKMVIRAGKSPIESDLDKIAISGRMFNAALNNNEMYLNNSNMRIQIIYK
ncbi:hypothetical protein ACNQO3_20205, partial [Acinetobacter calcoaceticus]